MRFVILLLCSLTLIACGADQPVELVDDAPKFETNYAVVPEESRLGFSTKQEGEPFAGQFSEFNAAIRFDETNLDDARVRVSIPLASIDAGSTDRNSNLPGKVWFDTKSFPIAVWESNAITAVEDGYAAVGTLTLKGVSRPVTVQFTLSQDALGRTVMQGEAVLDRTHWNVGEDPWDTQEYVDHAVMLDLLLVAESTR